MLCFFAFVLVLLCAPVPPVGAAPIAAPADFYGANIQALIRQGFVMPAGWGSFLRAGAQAGLTTARFDAAWEWAEPQAPGADGIHHYDWTRLDQVASALSAQGIRWLPVVDFPPAWARTAATGLPPERDGDFAAFAGAFAARYGATGTFWAQHPQLTPLPVHQVEVWTEANSSHFWAVDPDPAGYLQVFVAVRQALKAVDPSLQVLVSLGWQDFEGYATRLYDAGLKGQSDGVAFHPYVPTARGVVVLTRKLRAILTARGEPDLPIFMTEIGWPRAVSGPGAARAVYGPVSDASRAATAALAADALATSDCNVKDYLVYSLVEEQKDPTNLEDWLGIYDRDGAPTLTLQALASSAARWSTDGVRARAAQESALLPLCHGLDNDRAVASHTMAPDGQLPITLSWRLPFATRCTTMQADYYGDPLEDVSVFVRSYRGVQSGAMTRAAGQAQLCLSAASRAKPYLVWSRSGGLAASPVQLCRGAQCTTLSCRRAALRANGGEVHGRSATLRLQVRCGSQTLFGEPVTVDGVDREGGQHRLLTVLTGTVPKTVEIPLPRRPLRALRVRFGGDRTFRLGARVRSVRLIARGEGRVAAAAPPAAG